MSDIKKQILKQIEDKVLKSRLLKEQAKSKNTYQSKVLDFLKEVEVFSTLDKGYFDPLVAIAKDSLQKTIRAQFDPFAKVSVSIAELENGKRCVDTVTIAWSVFYTDKHKVEPEITLDAVTLIIEQDRSTS